MTTGKLIPRADYDQILADLAFLKEALPPKELSIFDPGFDAAASAFARKAPEVHVALGRIKRFREGPLAASLAADPPPGGPDR